MPLPNEQQLSDKQVLQMVEFAIERVRKAQNQHIETQSDPYADSDDRGAAKEAFRATVREFGWQWANVDRLLRIKPFARPLPTVAEMTGSDPDFTGDQTTDEYIRDIRGEPQPPCQCEMCSWLRGDSK